MDHAGVIHRFNWSKGGFDSIEDANKFLKSIFDGKQNCYNLRNKNFPRAIENEDKYFFIFDTAKQAIVGARMVLNITDKNESYYRYRVMFKDTPIKFVPPISLKELRQIDDEIIQEEFFKNKRYQSYRTINQTAVEKILKLRS